MRTMGLLPPAAQPEARSTIGEELERAARVYEIYGFGRRNNEIPLL